MKPSWNYVLQPLAMLSVVALVALGFGCATPPPPPLLDENQLYVGTPKEYEAYRRLVPSGGPTLSEQHAADIASYLKQDATMQMYSNRDLADPYYFWDSFEGLGWK